MAGARAWSPGQPVSFGGAVTRIASARPAASAMAASSEGAKARMPSASAAACSSALRAVAETVQPRCNIRRARVLPV